MLTYFEVFLVAGDESFHHLLLLLFRQLLCLPRRRLVDLRLREALVRDRVHVPGAQLGSNRISKVKMQAWNGWLGDAKYFGYDTLNNK